MLLINNTFYCISNIIVHHPSLVHSLDREFHSLCRPSRQGTQNRSDVGSVGIVANGVY